MDTTLSVAIVGACVTVVLALTQVVTTRLTSKDLKEALKLKNARDDQAAARLRLDTQAVKAEVTKTAQRLAAADSETHHQLKAIYHLVNSNLTEVVAARLDAVRGKLAFMMKFETLQRLNKIEPTADEKLEVAKTESEIQVLEDQLASRTKADDTANEERLLGEIARASGPAPA